MGKLEIAKRVIKKHIGEAQCGLFDSGDIMGDDKETLYDKDGLTIYICRYWAYFEVFGLSDQEFKELERYYYELGGL